MSENKPKIIWSEDARNDLQEIGDYIANHLQNPQAAKNTTTKIQDAIDTLADFPNKGTPLSAATDVKNTDYRIISSGSYLVFYIPDKDTVSIDRILYGRRDYVSILFADMLPDDE